MIDAHCHILPGVDDGVDSLETSKEIISNLSFFGIDKVVFTPHVNSHYGNIDKYKQQYKILKPVADNCGIKSCLGYEVNWKSLANFGYDNAKNYCFGNSNFFLLEFSYSSLPLNWQTVIFNLQGQGLNVIIAHPERNVVIAKDLSIAEQMRDMGCILMLSANFVLKSWMSGFARKSAKKLLKAGLVDIICSDAHRIYSYDCLSSAYKFAEKYGWDKQQNETVLAEVFA